MQKLAFRAAPRGRMAMALACLIGVAQAVQARVIDDFDSGMISLVGANATVQQIQSGLDPDRVVGGSRFLSFRSFAVPPSTLTLADAAGTLDVSPSGCCTYLTVRYGDTANPLNLNLLEDGSDRFVVHVAALTTGISHSLPRITAYDTQGHEAAIINGNEGNGLATLPFAVSIPFSSFPTVDFSNIRSIEIVVSRYGGAINQAGQSFALESIVTVPEPTSIGLLAGAGSTTIGFFGRPRRRLPGFA